MRGARPGWPIVLIVVGTVIVGITVPIAILAAANAVYAARPRQVEFALRADRFTAGPTDADGSRSCTPRGEDADLRAGTPVVLSDPAGRVLARTRLAHGVTTSDGGSCLVVVPFVQRVPLASTYRLRAAGRPALTLHPRRDDICDPDLSAYGDVLHLEQHPATGCDI